MTKTRQLSDAVHRFTQAYLNVLVNGPPTGDPLVEQERRIFADLIEVADRAEFVYEAPVAKPVCRFLDAAHEPIGKPDFDALIEASFPLAQDAVWLNKYRDQPDRQVLFQNFAFCDFIGHDGWLRTDDVTVGLTILGPHTDYPFHEHPARELYLLLNGPSDWAVDFGDYQHLVPGDWLLHTEMQPHAIRSLEKPMMAISAWRGEVLSRSRFTKKNK